MAPRKGAPPEPTTTKPSSRGSNRAPMAPSSRTTALTRSLSLTRSSAASRNVVIPLASAAATARTGISSMSPGTSAPPTSVADSGECRARMVPRRPAGPSPATSTSMSAPMRFSTSR